MEALSTQWLAVLSLVSVTVTVALIFKILSVKARRRAFDLITARDALEAHYDALNEIADDPALPESALKFLAHFSQAIADRESCTHFAVKVFLARQPSSERPPSWHDEMERLRRTRPDMVDNFQKAVSNGLIALFLRWPGNSSFLQVMLQMTISDRRRTSVIAEKVAHRDFQLHGDGLLAA